jgi:hypothetical protein
MLKLAAVMVMSLAASAAIFEASGPLETRAFVADVAGLFFLVVGLGALAILVLALLTERSLRHD